MIASRAIDRMKRERSFGNVGAPGLHVLKKDPYLVLWGQRIRKERASL